MHHRIAIAPDEVFQCFVRRLGVSQYAIAASLDRAVHDDRDPNITVWQIGPYDVRPMAMQLGKGGRRRVKPGLGFGAPITPPGRE